MTVAVRYFASIREALGPGETLAVEPGATVASVRDALIARGGAHARALARGKALRCAVNQVLAEESASVQAGAEIAFFPPVTGG